VTAEVRREAADGLAREFDHVEPVQLERPGHPRVWLEWYLPRADRARALRTRLQRDAGVAAVAIRRFTARDWASLWHNQVRGGPVGHRLYLAPVWEKRPDAGTRRIIRLDPGMGFGTGEHFTTRFCLEKLEQLCQKFAPRSVLDAGTGNGILAIAAAKLGCSRVLGFDNDPLAIVDARKHASLNRVGARVRLASGDARERLAKGRFDVVCANLFGPLLVELAPALTRCAARWLVLSGIREFEADGVAEVFASLGAREVARDGDGEWAGLLLDTRGHRT
jgi:ribosomal protein L11 methyltransferase